VAGQGINLALELLLLSQKLLLLALTHSLQPVEVLLAPVVHLIDEEVTEALELHRQGDHLLLDLLLGHHHTVESRADGLLLGLLLSHVGLHLTLELLGGILNGLEGAARKRRRNKGGGRNSRKSSNNQAASLNETT